jgi:multidrug efflux pump subunit AcrB
MNKLFAFFVDNWKFSLLSTLCIVVIGMLSSAQLQREAFPPVNFAVVAVSTVFPGASPEEVQDKVTNILEEELRGIEGVKDVRSISQNNLSEITIRIDIDGVDSDDVVSDIQKAIQRGSARLPPEVTEEPRVLEVDAKKIPVLELAVVGKSENRDRELVADALKDILEDVRGVSAVQLTGYVKRELQVLLDQSKLRNSAVGLAEVYATLSQQIKNIPSGYVDDREKINLVRVFGKKTSVSDLENTIVRANDAGNAIRIKNVGRVVDSGAKPEVLARINGEEATLLVVTKKADSDALSVLDEVRAQVQDFEKKLDSRFKLVVFNDEGARIRNRLDIVGFNAFSGMIIVLIVLFAFLPGKVGIFSSLSLPICALGTVSMMVFMGANFNIITMIALVICLGNLVDNSVVISENYTTLVESGVPNRDAAIQSAQQFWIPFTASTVTIISAFLPMLVTQGVMGQFIKWIPIVVSIALTLSLVESLTLLPARLQFLSPKRRSASSSDWFVKVETRFGHLIRWTLKRKYLTLGSLATLVVSGTAVTALLNRFELFPAEGVEYYVARLEAPPETSIYRTDELAAQVSRDVMKVMDPADVQSVIAKTGLSQTDPSDPKAKMGSNVGIILVAIKPERAPDLSVATTLAMLKKIETPPGLKKLTFEPIEGGPPVGKPLTLTLRSTSYEQLSRARDEILGDLGKVPGLINLEDDEQSTGKEFLFDPNDEVRSYLGLSVDGIGLNLRTALEGSTAARLTEFGKDFDLVVRFDESSRNSLAQLKKSEIFTPRGNLVPITSVGSFSEVDAPRIKRRFDFKNSITITSEVDNINMTSGSANDSARDSFAKVSAKYPLVSAIFGGEEESTNESLQSLAIALVLALFGIFATLVFTFGSYSQSLLVLSTIPLGLVGVFYSFTVIQRPLSFLAFIGVVGLSGVVINSAIILVDYIREMKATRSDLNLEDLLVEASARRLRAVLATGLTTVVGLLPAAFGWGGYDAILVDITLALSWGMIIGTVLTLIWVPSGFLILHEFKGALLRFLRQRFNF